MYPEIAVFKKIKIKFMNIQEHQVIFRDISACLSKKIKFKKMQGF